MSSEKVDPVASTSSSNGPKSTKKRQSRGGKENNSDSEEEVSTGLPGQRKPKYRQSESMKLNLKQIELLSARTTEERIELDAVRKHLEVAENELMKELQQLQVLQKYSKMTALNSMSEEEWREFFEKYFVRGEEDEVTTFLALREAKNPKFPSNVQNKNETENNPPLDNMKIEISLTNGWVSPPASVGLGLD